MIPLDLKYRYQNLYLKPFRLLLTTKRLSSAEPVCLANLCSLRKSLFPSPLHASSAFFYADAHRYRRVYQGKTLVNLWGQTLIRLQKDQIFSVKILIFTHRLYSDLLPTVFYTLNKSIIFEMRDVLMSKLSVITQHHGLPTSYNSRCHLKNRKADKRPATSSRQVLANHRH